MLSGPSPWLLAPGLVLSLLVVLAVRDNRLSFTAGPSSRYGAAPGPLPLFKAAGGEMFLLQRPRFLLFGDSLTERSFDTGGWGAVLAHHYYRKARLWVTRS